MATVAEQRRARFNAEFGRMLGDKIGTTRANYTDASLAPAFTNSFDLRRSGSGGDSDSRTKAEEVDAAVKEKMLLKLAREGAAEGDQSIFGSIKDRVFDTAKRGLDVVSRPAYAVAEGMRNAQESINEGEPLWSLGDDFIWGAGQGAGGFKKTGFGDVVEEATNYNSEGKSTWNKIAAGAWFGEKSPGEYIGQMEQTDPEAAKWLKRGLGIVGDVAYDPTTYISFGTAKVARESIENAVKAGGRRALKEGIQEGTIKTGKDAIIESVDRAARKAADPTALKTQKIRTVIPATKMYGPNVNAIDDLVDDVTTQSQKLFYEVTGGAQKGKIIGGEEATRTVSELTAEGFRNRRLGVLDRNTKRFIDGMEGTKPKLTTAQLNTLKKDDVFRVFHDTYVDELAVKGTDPIKAFNKAKAASAAAMEKETTEVFARVQGSLVDEMLNVPTVRVFGKDIAYLPKIGAAHKRVGKALSNTSADRLQKAFSWTSNFPGYSSLIAQKARALGADDFEKFQLRVFELARGTNKADRRIIQEALEEGLVLTGELELKRQAIRAMYDELFMHEVSQGLRKGVNATMLPDYTYVYIRGNNKLKKPFLREKEQAVLDGTFRDFGSKEARRRGLKPVNDAFENLLYRKIKSNRQLTRQYFNRDLASHYGIKGSISAGEAKRRGLRAMSDKDIPEDIAKTLKPGEHLYLDQDIAHVMDNYRELSTVGSEAGQEWARQIDYLTRKFKVWNTVYYPAFHIRNMIGDIYMGALDGVKTKDYAKVIKSWFNQNTATLDVAGNTIPFTKVKQLFDENAASGGFLSAEVGNMSRRTTKGAAGVIKDPRTIGPGIRKFSESREDFGRFVHFYRALSDEMPAAMRRHRGDIDKALAEATNAATFRVNKYKFDYGALTRFEQNIMRRGIPFYTFMRKAIPTLSEAALLSPRNLSYTNKIFNSMFPENRENFDTLTIAPWIKDQLFAQIPGMGGSEPTGVTGNFLPQNVFNDLSTNPLASVNPFLKAPFELKYGKDTFTGQPVNGPWDVIKNNVRAFKTVDRLTNPELTGAEKTGTILGIPITKVSEKRQDQALQEIKYNIKGNLRALNTEAEKHGLHIYLSESKFGTKIKIKNYDSETGSSGTVVAEFDSYEEAVKALKGMYG